jgi:hypothetical protein
METRAKQLSVAGSLAAAMGVVLFLFVFDPERVPVYPVCLFHKWTGLNCPGCGSLRAMHQLLHGNVIEALRLNALLVLSIPIFAWIGFRLLRQRVQNIPEPAVRPLWIWIYAGIWMVYGIARELPVSLFAAGPP